MSRQDVLKLVPDNAYISFASIWQASGLDVTQLHKHLLDLESRELIERERPDIQDVNITAYRRVR